MVRKARPGWVGEGFRGGLDGLSNSRTGRWADKLYKKLRSVEGRQSFFINENIFRVMASSFAGQAMAATMAMAMAMATSRKFDGDEDGDGKGMWGVWTAAKAEVCR